MKEILSGTAAEIGPLLRETERLGRIACSALAASHRGTLGQFLTPAPVASFLAQMFDSSAGDVRLLDPGAGVGTLTSAFVTEVLNREKKPRSLSLTAWEVEKSFVPALEEVMRRCVEAAHSVGIPARFSIHNTDFLEDGVALIDEQDLFACGGKRERFTHAILNPPYSKINTESAARGLLRRAGLETSNLYTGFLWLASQLLTPEGQLVAITPRSFCNGPYFNAFRKQFFDCVALERAHVFDRRDTLFSGDEVLQENLVMRARRSSEAQVSVTLSSSAGVKGENMRCRAVPYAHVLSPSDVHRVLHLALDDADDAVKQRVGQMAATLEDLGLAVSTGRVVDFRAKAFLRADPQAGAVPLIYPVHFNGGGVHWPRSGSRKPNALVAIHETNALLVPNGIYVLVKRFTAKEEKRRVVATLFSPKGALADYPSIGFENHLNYFYGVHKLLDEPLALGLAIYLNSTLVDSYFRQFSGHTQVNATDLRNLRYPTRRQLRALSEGFEGTALDQPVLAVSASVA